MNDPGAITIHINGEPIEFEMGRDVQPNETLAHLLKERLGYTGLKVGCDQGACGACTVIMDNQAILSCMTLAVEADGHEILTIEGLAENDPVITAFATQCEPGHGTAIQCGYCTPGFVMSTKALLIKNQKPTLKEIKHNLSGNLCRCGCYQAIAQAALKSAELSMQEDQKE